MRIAFEAFSHIAHRRASGLIAGHVARLIQALTTVVELAPALHKEVGAKSGIGAQFGFKLESSDCAADLTAGRLAGQLGIFCLGGFSVVRAIGPHRLKGLAGLI